MKSQRERIWNAIGHGALNSMQICELTGIEYTLTKKMICEMRTSRLAKIIVVGKEKINGRIYKKYAREDKDLKYSFAPPSTKSMAVENLPFCPSMISRQSWFSALVAV